jgi:hypothetical protein
MTKDRKKFEASKATAEDLNKLLDREEFKKNMATVADLHKLLAVKDRRIERLEEALKEVAYWRTYAGAKSEMGVISNMSTIALEALEETE